MTGCTDALPSDCFMMSTKDRLGRIHIGCDLLAQRCHLVEMYVSSNPIDKFNGNVVSVQIVGSIEDRHFQETFSTVKGGSCSNV